MKKISLLALVGLCLSLSLLGCTDPNPPTNEQSLASIFQTQTPTAASSGSITVANNSGPVGANPPALTDSPLAGSGNLPDSTAVIAATPTPVSNEAQTETGTPGAVSTSPEVIGSKTSAATPARTNPTTALPRTTNQPKVNLTPLPVKTKTAPVATFTPVPTIPVVDYSGPLSEVVRGRTGRKQVALTIDAGADGKAFPKIIAALNQYNVHLTFFLTGQWVQQNPVFTQQIVANGQEIANHSWDHPDFTKLTDEQARDEIQKAESLITRFTGRSPRPLWRFPYGARNPHMQQLLNSMGYRSIFWTLDSLDSVGQPKTAQFLFDRITKQTDAQLDGEIILMHIGNSTTGDALPQILDNLKQRGFQIVTVSQLLS